MPNIHSRGEHSRPCVLRRVTVTGMVSPVASNHISQPAFNFIPGGVSIIGQRRAISVSRSTRLRSHLEPTTGSTATRLVQADFNLVFAVSREFPNRIDWMASVPNPGSYLPDQEYQASLSLSLSLSLLYRARFRRSLHGILANAANNHYVSRVSYYTPVLHASTYATREIRCRPRE